MLRAFTKWIWKGLAAAEAVQRKLYELPHGPKQLMAKEQ
eukprot:gene33512-38966_t